MVFCGSAEGFPEVTQTCDHQIIVHVLVNNDGQTRVLEGGHVVDGSVERTRPMAHTQEQIVRGFAEIVNEIADIPIEDVMLEKSFADDLDIDDASMVEVVVACEERFDMKFPDDEVKNLQTVEDAAAYIPQPSGLDEHGTNDLFLGGS